MNEFEKDRSTSEQLVELLDNEQNITICSDVVHGLYHEYKHLQEENEELKKQLEEKIILEMKLKDKLEEQRKEYQETYKDVREEIKEYKNQQKEFIAYLENEIQSCELTCDLIFNHNKEMKIYKIILLKYKEIIGGKYEGNKDL